MKTIFEIIIIYFEIYFDICCGYEHIIKKNVFFFSILAIKDNIFLSIDHVTPDFKKAEIKKLL
jgi:hypothetical protein